MFKSFGGRRETAILNGAQAVPTRHQLRPTKMVQNATPVTQTMGQYIPRALLKEKRKETASGEGKKKGGGPRNAPEVLF